MKSNDLGQGELELKPEMITPDLSQVMRCKSMTSALKLCVSLSGEANDKPIYMDLGIDAGQWSRIMNGTNSFPQDRLGELFDRCGNEAPLIWLATQRGYGLKKLETEVERENRLLKERIAEMEKERETIVKFQKEVSGHV